MFKGKKTTAKPLYYEYLKMGYSIFYPHRGMDVKIQGVPWLGFLPGVSISRYIFPGGKFAGV